MKFGFSELRSRSSPNSNSEFYKEAEVYRKLICLKSQRKLISKVGLKLMCPNSSVFSVSSHFLFFFF